MAEETLRQHEAHSYTIEAEQQVVREAPRRTPVVADVDVLVAGGGPAGVGAAIAAAREGAKVLVIERHGMLGGVWTAGLLNPYFDFKKKGWLVEELINRLEKRDAWMKWLFAATFDTEAMKIVLEEMLAEAGAEFWYHCFIADTIVEDGRLRGVVVESKAGREAVLAKVVIDCTGDGDVCARAGVPFHLGRMSDGNLQPMTLMFEVTGVRDFKQTNSMQLYDLIQMSIMANGLPFKQPYERVNYTPWIIHIPREDTADVQATHVYGLNPLDPRDITKGTVAARKQAHNLVRAMKGIPDLNDIKLTQTAAHIGVREARRIQGRYTLTLADLQAGRDLEDAITFGAFGVDVHDTEETGDPDSAHMAPMKPYGIPYSCLLPVNRTHALMAGRCISGSHEAHASYRVTGTCMGMGQAAGLAAAVAAAEGVSPHSLDGARLRNMLEERGAGMLPDYLASLKEQ